MLRRFRWVIPSRLVVPFLVPALLVVLGTVGYRLLEGWSWFDCLYMTVITLTTVGFLEVHEMSQAGRAFTMVLCLGGVFTLFYAATATIRLIVSGEAREALEKQLMEQKLDALDDHMVICGYGRVGRLVAQALAAEGIPFVVIERNPEQVRHVKPRGGVVLIGDATSDELLRRAAIERAKALIAVVGTDADNLFITMSARLLNERLFIVARADDDTSVSKFVRAGANRVVSPYLLGGFQVAQAVLRPNVLDFIELATRTEHVELQIEEALVSPKSSLVGRTLGDCELGSRLGLIVVAIKKAGDRMQFNPSPEMVLEAGDILIALGQRDSLNRLEELAGE